VAQLKHYDEIVPITPRLLEISMSEKTWPN